MAKEAAEKDDEKKKEKPTKPKRGPKKQKTVAGNVKILKRCQKLKVTPDPKSLPVLRRWNKACIDTWNLCLKTLKQHDIQYQGDINTDTIQSLLRSHCQGAKPNTIVWWKTKSEIAAIRAQMETAAEAFKSEHFPHYFPVTKKRKRLTAEQKAEVDLAIKNAGLIYIPLKHGVERVEEHQGGLEGTPDAGLQQTPKDIRAGIVDDIITSIKSNRTRIQNLWKVKQTTNSKVRIPDWELHAKELTPGNSYIPVSGTQKGTKYDKNSRTFILFIGSGAAKLVGGERIKASPHIPDWKLIQKKGQWFACISFDREVGLTPPALHQRQTIASIDPGMRTMLTVYSPEGTITELGNDIQPRMKQLMQRIYRRGQHIKRLNKAMKTFRRLSPGDTLTSLPVEVRDVINSAPRPRTKIEQPPSPISTLSKPWYINKPIQKHRKQRDRGLVKLNETGVRIENLDKKVLKRFRRKRYRMRRAIKKVRQHLSNYVDGRHHAYTHYLCTNFKNILIPRFNVKGIIANKARVDDDGKFVKQSILSKRTKQILLAMKHGKFRDRLVMKASEYAETQVWTAGEEYTTKTCGACLTLNHKVGSAKVFRCMDPNCGLVIDRDWNGARNVLLKCVNAQA